MWHLSVRRVVAYFYLVDPNVRVALRALRMALIGVSLYAALAYVSAVLTRQPYYQNFLVASLAWSLAATITTAAIGPAAGFAAGVVVLLVHFGLAWLGLLLTGGKTSHLLRDIIGAIVITGIVGIPFAVYCNSRRLARQTTVVRLPRK